MNRQRIHNLVFILLVLVGLALMGVLVVESCRECRSSVARRAKPADPLAKPNPTPAQQRQAPVEAHVARRQPTVKPITQAQIRDADLSLKEAMFYEPLAKAGTVRCLLCPRKCLLRPGERGACKVRVNLDGRLRTLVYGKPLSLAVDPIEKKPLVHVLPGSRAFSLATAGCNLGCIFCQNWQISQAFPEKAPHRNVTPKELVALALKHRCRAIAYTYTEPTVFYEYMFDTAKLAREHGLKNLWITCGYINPKPLRQLCKYLDAANVDLKGFTAEFYRKYCFGELQPVLNTLKILKEEDVFFEITNLVIPNANDNPAQIRAMCKWIVTHLGPDTPLHFSRFFPKYKLRNKSPTPVKTLVRAREVALEEGLHHVFIGNVRVDGGEDTRCPECGKILVKRMGYFVTLNAVEKGKCKHCGAPIPGIWPGAEGRSPWPSASAPSRKTDKSALDW